YMCRRVRLTFEASAIPAMGLTTYAWVKSEVKPAEVASLISKSNVMENELIKIEIAEDGSFSLTDKKNGQVYRDLGFYENTGDIGNEYMYKQPDGEAALTTKGQTAQISVLEDTPYRASIEIGQNWSIPAMADSKLDEEQHELIYYPNRKAQRSSDMVPLRIRTVVSLNRSGKG
ncbi:alpha-mannosidase, partial [Clostridium perfringens]